MYFEEKTSFKIFFFFVKKTIVFFYVDLSTDIFRHNISDNIALRISSYHIYIYE